MKDLPNTRHLMVRAGYRKTGDSLCKGCQAPIEWWKTTNNKSMPFDALKPGETEYTPAVVHWSTCPNAKDFKGAASPKPGTDPRTVQRVRRDTPESDARMMLAKHNARVVVVIGEFGTSACWADGIPAEDLRHDLISAGNFIRTEISKKEANRS